MGSWGYFTRTSGVGPLLIIGRYPFCRCRSTLNFLLVAVVCWLFCHRTPQALAALEKLSARPRERGEGPVCLGIKGIVYREFAMSFCCILYSINWWIIVHLTFLRVHHFMFFFVRLIHGVVHLSKNIRFVVVESGFPQDTQSELYWCQLSHA